MLVLAVVPFSVNVELVPPNERTPPFFKSKSLVGVSP